MKVSEMHNQSTQRPKFHNFGNFFYTHTYGAWAPNMLNLQRWQSGSWLLGWTLYNNMVLQGKSIYLGHISLFLEGHFSNKINKIF